LQQGGGAGGNSVAIGVNTLQNGGAGYNVAVGSGAMQSVTTSTNNVAMGYQSASAVTTGNQHVCIGAGAGSGISDSLLPSSSSSSSITAIGYNACAYNASTNSTYPTPQSNCVYIGSGAQPFAGNSSSTYANNQIVLGNSAITDLFCAAGSIQTLSDQRDKTDILPMGVGGAFLDLVEPVHFTWNTRDGAKRDRPDCGFIAQQLIQAQEDAGVYIPHLVNNSNPDQFLVDASKLMPVMVEAIKELRAEIAELKRICRR
jgi:hypothetical protein